MSRWLRCRFDVLAAACQFLDGAVTDSIRPCTDRAEYSTTVVRRGEGWDIEVHVNVCAAHELLAHDATGRKESKKLRPPSTS